MPTGPLETYKHACHARSHSSSLFRNARHSSHAAVLTHCHCSAHIEINLFLQTVPLVPLGPLATYKRACCARSRRPSLFHKARRSKHAIAKRRRSRQAWLERSQGVAPRLPFMLFTT